MDEKETKKIEGAPAEANAEAPKVAEVRKGAEETVEAPKSVEVEAAKAEAPESAKVEAEAELKKKPVKKKRKRKTGITSKAKKKSAVARAVIKKGSGKIRINKRDIGLFDNGYLYDFITEPVNIAGEPAKAVDINVRVHGGGFSGQAVSARGAIAKALVEFTKDDKLRQKYLGYDRMLLVDDVRKVESKKPLGTKARKKKQSSKR